MHIQKNTSAIKVFSEYRGLRVIFSLLKIAAKSEDKDVERK